MRRSKRTKFRQDLLFLQEFSIFRLILHTKFINLTSTKSQKIIKIIYCLKSEIEFSFKNHQSSFIFQNSSNKLVLVSSHRNSMIFPFGREKFPVISLKPQSQQVCNNSFLPSIFLWTLIKLALFSNFKRIHNLFN